METTFKPFLVQDPERPAPVETTALACAIGLEMAQRWPHAVARICVGLSGALFAAETRKATGEAFLCGLSGLADCRSDARKLASIFALNTKMMAIRLNGRTLVAFTPDRDIRFTAETDGWPVGRVRAGAWSAGGGRLGVVERILLAREPGGTLPVAAPMPRQWHAAAMPAPGIIA